MSGSQNKVARAVLGVLGGGGGVQQLELGADGLGRLVGDTVFHRGGPGDGGLPLERQLEVPEGLARDDVARRGLSAQHVPLEAPALRDVSATEGGPLLPVHEGAPLPGRGRWRGPVFMCSSNKQYKINGVKDCFARGYERTGFFEVDTGDQKNWQVRLTEADRQESKKK